MNLNPESVYDFIQDAKEVTILDNGAGKVISPSGLKISPFATVFRSLIDADYSKLMFPIDIDYHESNFYDGLMKSITLAREIDKKHKFSWKFSGRSLHGISYINVNEGEDLVTKFLSYAKYFIQNYGDKQIINDKIVYLGLDPQIYTTRPKIRALGSINSKTGLYNIWVDLDESFESILNRASKNKVGKKSIPELKLDIPLDCYKISKSFFEGRTDNYVQTICETRPNYYEWFDKHKPPCIQNMIKQRNPNFSERAVLFNYLVNTHSGKDFAHNLLSKICDEDKYNHAVNGHEIDRFFYFKYSSMSCDNAKIRGVKCNNCGRQFITQEDINK